MEGFLNTSLAAASANQLQSLISLLTILSAHVNLKMLSVHVTPDTPEIQLLRVLKYTSSLGLYANCLQETKNSTYDRNGHILISELSDEHLIKVLAVKPMVVMTSGQPYSSQSLVVSPHTSLYVVQDGSRVGVVSECLRVFHLSAKDEVETKLVAQRGVSGGWEDVTGVVRVRGSLQRVVVSLGLMAPTEISGIKVNLNILVYLFRRQGASVYWELLQEYLKFRTRFIPDLIPEGDLTSFNYIDRTMLFIEEGKADFSSTLILLIPERVKFIDFMETGFDMRFHFIIRKPTYVYSWQSIIKAFTLDVWVMCALTVLISSAVLRIASIKLQNQHLSFSTCLFMVFGFFCNQGCPHIPHYTPVRITCFISLIFSITMYYHFVSNFYSFLSTQEVAMPFHSLEELMEKKSFSVIIDPETSIYALMKNAEEGLLKDIWDTLLKDDPNHIVTAQNVKQMLQRVCKGEATWLGLPSILAYNTECTLVAIDPGYFPNTVAFAIRKGFPYISQFRIGLLRILEGGLVNMAKRKYTDLEGIVKTNVSREPVSLEQVMFHLVVYVTAVFLSLLMLCAERFYRKQGKQRTGSVI